MSVTVEPLPFGTIPHEAEDWLDKADKYLREVFEWASDRALYARDDRHAASERIADLMTAANILVAEARMLVRHDTDPTN